MTEQGNITNPLSDLAMRILGSGTSGRGGVVGQEHVSKVWCRKGGRP